MKRSVNQLKRLMDGWGMDGWIDRWMGEWMGR